MKNHKYLSTTMKKGRNMRRTMVVLTTVLTFLSIAVIGCSRSTNPAASSSNNAEAVLTQSLASTSVVTQDLSQLNSAGVFTGGSYGIFSIGWNQFVGPNIVNAGTIGKAFVVVHSDTTQSMIRAGGMDLGNVALSYDTSKIALIKHIDRKGGVLYTTFDRGLREPQTLPTMIPFISNASYQFTVSGSSAFTAGTFTIKAPASLLKITSNSNGDSVSLSNNLTITWTGGSTSDSVLLRITPHLRPHQMGDRDPGDHHGRGDGRHREMGGMMGGTDHGIREIGPSEPTDDDVPFCLGPEFEKAIIKTVANSGSVTISAADIQALVSGTASVELMISVAQEVKQTVQHDGKALTLLLRNGDRIVVNTR